MKRIGRRRLLQGVAVGVVLGAVVIASCMVLPRWAVPYRDTAAVDIRDPQLIERGRYVARLGDCAACHSAPGGQPYAGGRGLQTPVGTIYSTNITPDPDTGIGAYRYGDFERAVRRGVRPDHQVLFPAMPYPSYQIVSDADMQALYAYFMTAVAPVRQENPPTTMPWPLSLRWPQAAWQLLFVPSRAPWSEPQANADPVSRGAYLVEGLGHCGACHTPRGIGFQEQSLHDSDDGRYLSGSAVEGWFAKNLRNEGLGLATWSEAEIVEFLRTGRTDRVAVFGAMADVVAHSSRYMSVDDLSAIAAYLKQLAPQPGGRGAWQRGEDLTTAALRSGTDTSPGALLYVEQCSLCHRLDGQGAPRIFPSLAGNSIVFAEDARSLIQVTLAGDRMPLTDADRMAFAMPAFDHLSDGELAQVLSYVRAGWGNNAGPVSEWDIRRMRAELAHKPTHHVPEVTP